MSKPQQYPFQSDGDVAIHVTDLAKAKTFYGGVMGFRLIEERENHLAYHTGVFTLWINQDDKVIPYIPAFAVSSYSEAKERLIAGGCKIIRDSPEHGSLYFVDPFGIVADVIEKKEA